MGQNTEPEGIYAELRRRAVTEFGEERAAELEEFLRAAAQQVADVADADTQPDLEPLVHS